MWLLPLGVLFADTKVKQTGKKVFKQYSKAGLLPVLISFQERAEQIAGPGGHRELGRERRAQSTPG